MSTRRNIIQNCSMWLIVLAFQVLGISDSIGNQEQPRLLLSLRVLKDIIYQYEPVQVGVGLENQGKEPLRVLPLRVGSIEVFESIYASLTLEITYPDEKQVEVRHLQPYYGPLKEIEGPFLIPQTDLTPGSQMKTSFYLSGNWVGERQILFSKPGIYTLRFKYFPFVKRDGKSENIDFDKFIKSNEVQISVKELTDKDKECWEKIRSSRLWWLLYDPDGRNKSFFSKAEREEFKRCTETINQFSEIAKEYPDSVFQPYLQYVRIMAVIKTNEVTKISQGDIKILQRLAKSQEFVYNKSADQLLQKIQGGKLE